jgi:hypothetical protein
VEEEGKGEGPEQSWAQVVRRTKECREGREEEKEEEERT